MLHLLDIGHDFFLCEFLRRLPDQDMLFAEIFRGKYFVGRPGFQQKAATGD